jgi:hypothetical protein
MSLELKIKSKHLSEEARIIRFEEHKLGKQVRWYIRQHETTGANETLSLYKCKPHQQRSSLHEHRIKDVRRENRATFLARAYIAGQNYLDVEIKRKPEREYEFYQFIIPRIVNMVAKYGADKVPIKIYDRTKGGYIDNPELVKVTVAVKAWLGATN